MLYPEQLSGIYLLDMEDHTHAIFLTPGILTASKCQQTATDQNLSRVREQLQRQDRKLPGGDGLKHRMT